MHRISLTELLRVQCSSHYFKFAVMLLSNITTRTFAETLVAT